jgi:hypothetical protein
MKKEIGQVQEKKRKEIIATIYYQMGINMCHIYLLKNPMGINMCHIYL